MQPRRSVFFFFLLFSAFVLQAQETEKPQHVSFLAEYRIPVSKAVINHCGKGLVLECHVGFGKKTIVSVFGGWAWPGKLSNGKFTGSFADDFEQHLSTGNRTGLDSIGLAFLADDLHTMQGWTVPAPPYHDGYHESSYYFGISVALPNRLPVLKIYHGITRGVGMSDTYYTPGNCTEGYTNDGANHFTRRPLTWGAGITFPDPLRWIRGPRTAFLQFMTVSYYYEVRDFSKATYRYRSNCTIDSSTMYFRDFTTPEFIAKYKNDVSFGFRLGFRLAPHDLKE